MGMNEDRRRWAWVAAASFSAWSAAMAFHSLFLRDREPIFAMDLLMCSPVFLALIYAARAATTGRDLVPICLAVVIPAQFVQTLVAGIWSDPVVREISIMDLEFWTGSGIISGLMIFFIVGVWGGRLVFRNFCGV